MANIIHRTLQANVVETVQLERDCQYAQVMNRSGTAEIYVAVDGAEPTVGGDDCHATFAAMCAIRVQSQKQGATVVKLISAGTPTCTVEAL